MNGVQTFLLLHFFMPTYALAQHFLWQLVGLLSDRSHEVLPAICPLMLLSVEINVLDAVLCVVTNLKGQ